MYATPTSPSGRAAVTITGGGMVGGVTVPLLPPPHPLNPRASNTERPTALAPPKRETAARAYNLKTGMVGMKPLLRLTKPTTVAQRRGFGLRENAFWFPGLDAGRAQSVGQRGGKLLTVSPRRR